MLRVLDTLTILHMPQATIPTHPRQVIHTRTLLLLLLMGTPGLYQTQTPRVRVLHYRTLIHLRKSYTHLLRATQALDTRLPKSSTLPPRATTACAPAVLPHLSLTVIPTHYQITTTIRTSTASDVPQPLALFTKNSPAAQTMLEVMVDQRAPAVAQGLVYPSNVLPLALVRRLHH